MSEFNELLSKYKIPYLFIYLCCKQCPRVRLASLYRHHEYVANIPHVINVRSAPCLKIRNMELRYYMLR